MPPEGDEKDVSLAQEFAEAFSGGDSGVPGGGGSQSASGGSPQGDGADGGDDADKGGDPLANLTFDQILQHPELSKAANSWADKIANKRVAAEVEMALARGRNEGREAVTAESRDKFFSELAKDPEELGKELAADPDLALEYAEWQRLKKAANVSADAVAHAAEVYALAVQIQTIKAALDEAGLPADKLADPKLDPMTYVDQRAQGVVEWGKAVTNAIAEHKAAQASQQLTEEAREALRQEEQARLDAQRPGGLGVAGRGAGPKPDLIKTPTHILFQQAFS
jgi:hypothetical protein